MSSIIIKGAREHNLKNIDLELPKGKFIVFTGLSGSGKSTLAFDTIFAEGQRRYLESLSSYARQFLGQMEKPDVDYIEGLSPAIAIDQKSASHNPRSTVGTVTEINDYLRLLYARVGVPHCPICKRVISSLSVEEMAEKTLEHFQEKSSVEILAPLVRGRKGEYQELLATMFKKGFSWAYVDQKKVNLADWKKLKLTKYQKHTIEILVDEIEIKSENLSRIFESIETTTKISDGLMKAVETEKPENNLLLNQKLACPIHGAGLPELEPRLFSFNSPQGACPECQGLGTKKEIDPTLLMPNRNLTIAQGGLLPWNFKLNNYYGHLLKAVCQKFAINQNTRLKDLSEADLDILLFGPEKEYDQEVKVKYFFKTGSGYYNLRWSGLIDFLLKRYQKTDSETVRKDIERYMSQKPCPICHGTRFQAAPLLVTFHGLNIAQFSQLTISEALNFIQKKPLSTKEKLIAGRLVREIENRLGFLQSVGLEYLTLSRSAVTLSGGEAQRIRLASQIGSGLTGVLYILDEPSIGLHARDNHKLLTMLKKLKDLGNTVIVIEHDEETIRASEHLVDIGPGAGTEGGKIIHNGSLNDLLKNSQSLTAQYLNRKKIIPIPAKRRVGKNRDFLVVKGANQNNLKNITAEFPLGAFTCVTGVSGSGKSSLVEDVLYKNLARILNHSADLPGKVKEISGYQKKIKKVILVDQSPIGRTPRSNPATYTGAFTFIRELFAATPAARAKGYDPGRFSFNVSGGRCENCKGDGFLKIEMQFMADVYLPCDVCKGKRYNSETLKIQYKNKNIAEVLAMTIEEATKFFSPIPAINDKISTLNQVGLNYLQLGQSATTLSGGEAQRVKLASELSRKSTGDTLYVLDEPTTGLHFEDIRRLLEVINRLVDAGNTVVMIEHNLDVIKTADWIIDLGPEGGAGGGRVIASGTPEEFSKWHRESYTGKYLREILKKY